MVPGLYLRRRLLRYVRPCAWVFAIALAGTIVVATGDLIMAWLVIPIVRNFQTPDPGLTRWLPLALVGVFALRGVGAYIAEFGMSWTGHRVVFDPRRALIDKRLKLPASHHDVNASAVLQSKVTFDAQELAGALARVLDEMICGPRVVRVFGGERYERGRAVDATDRLRQSMTRQSSAGAASAPVTQLLAAVAVGLIVGAALARSKTGVPDFATFASHTVARVTLLERLRSLGGLNVHAQRGLAAADSISGLLDRDGLYARLYRVRFGTMRTEAA